MKHERLRDGAEFDAIRDMIAQWGDTARGIGDDGALVDVPRGDHFVASVDASIEGRHFRQGWFSARQIGYRAVAAAMSDLAAMAARPRAVLLSLIVPDDWRDDLTQIASGAGEAVANANSRIVGGNLAAGDTLSITTTVLGSVCTPLTRDGARVGDHVYVTGRLGACGAALRALLAGQKPHADQLARFAAPVPRVNEARWLAARGATAATDISDGLAADAANIEAASGVRLAIDANRLPVWDGIQTGDAFVSGEEYELLVTAPDLDCAEFKARFNLALTDVGVVQTATAFDTRLPRDRGFDHFSP